MKQQVILMANALLLGACVSLSPPTVETLKVNKIVTAYGAFYSPDATTYTLVINGDSTFKWSKLDKQNGKKDVKTGKLSDKDMRKLKQYIIDSNYMKVNVWEKMNPAKHCVEERLTIDTQLGARAFSTGCRSVFPEAIEFIYNKIEPTPPIDWLFKKDGE